MIDGCAASRAGRRTTWINRKIRALYRDLFDAGYCHTVETWTDGQLVGGLYGVALHGAFFGESMFSTERDASKVALVYLCARLIHGGFSLLDTQFVTEHLKQFGTIEIERDAFHALLEKALAHQADLPRPAHGCEPARGARHRPGRGGVRAGENAPRYSSNRWAATASSFHSRPMPGTSGMCTNPSFTG